MRGPTRAPEPRSAQSGDGPASRCCALPCPLRRVRANRQNRLAVSWSWVRRVPGRWDQDSSSGWAGSLTSAASGVVSSTRTWPYSSPSASRSRSCDLLSIVVATDVEPASDVAARRQFVDLGADLLDQLTHGVAVGEWGHDAEHGDAQDRARTGSFGGRSGDLGERHGGSSLSCRPAGGSHSLRRLAVSGRGGCFSVESLPAASTHGRSVRVMLRARASSRVRWLQVQRRRSSWRGARRTAWQTGAAPTRHFPAHNPGIRSTSQPIGARSTAKPSTAATQPGIASRSLKSSIARCAPTFKASSAVSRSHSTSS